MTDPRERALQESRERIKNRARKMIVAHEAINTQFIVSLSVEDLPETSPEEIVAYFRSSLIGFVVDGHTISDINDFVYDAIAAKYPERHIEITVNDVENKIGYYVVYSTSFPSQSIKI